MQKITHKELLDAGVHFGHLKRKWNPKMAPYIFMEHKGIHITDLNKTIEKLEEAAAALKQIASTGKKILFVATKKQGKDFVRECAKRVNMPYATERWLGGMLTNFSTIRKSVKKMDGYNKLIDDGTFDTITKKERLRISREKSKLEKVLGGIADLNRLPTAIFIVDITKEHIALAEAKKLNITTFALIDTNADPTIVDFPIPANDDASKSIAVITNYVTNAIEEGLAMRAKEKEAEDKEAEAIKEDTEEDSLAKEIQTEEKKESESTARKKTKKSELVTSSAPKEDKKEDDTEADTDSKKGISEKTDSAS